MNTVLIKIFQPMANGMYMYMYTCTCIHMYMHTHVHVHVEYVIETPKNSHTSVSILRKGQQTELTIIALPFIKESACTCVLGYTAISMQPPSQSMSVARGGRLAPQTPTHHSNVCSISPSAGNCTMISLNTASRPTFSQPTPTQAHKPFPPSFPSQPLPSSLSLSLSLFLLCYLTLTHRRLIQHNYTINMHTRTHNTCNATR